MSSFMKRKKNRLDMLIENILVSCSIMYVMYLSVMYNIVSVNALSYAIRTT